MKAFHTIWTEPVASKHGSFCMNDYDILVMMISALSWRKHNGQIDLFADSQAVNYLERVRLQSLWDNIKPLSVSKSIKPEQFWAAGKIVALSALRSPAVSLDMDLIVWKNIDAELKKKDISVVHREKLNDVYPNKSFFKMKNGYMFNENWSWRVLPCNTALLYIKENSFRQYYTSSALKFMRQRCSDNMDQVYSMVFAEQRLLSMCAAEKGKQINALLNVDDLNNQDTFTHIWGYKRTLQSDADERKQFCKRCLNRIEKDFPEYYQTALKAVKM